MGQMQLLPKSIPQSRGHERISKRNTLTNFSQQIFRSLGDATSTLYP